jgi:hypothetical protein
MKPGNVSCAGTLPRDLKNVPEAVAMESAHGVEICGKGSAVSGFELCDEGLNASGDEFLCFGFGLCLFDRVHGLCSSGMCVSQGLSRSKSRARIAIKNNMLS